MPLEDTSSAGASPTRSNPAPTLSQPKPQPKIIRVLTVMAYMLSVSMAAILLSIYYIFVWNGGGNATQQQQQQQQPLAAPLIALNSDVMGGAITSLKVVGGETMDVADNTTAQLLVYTEGVTEEAGTTGEGLNFGVIACF